jgi:hypothetical protein
MSFSTRLRWTGFFLLQGSALSALLAWQVLSTNAQQPTAPRSKNEPAPLENIPVGRTPWVGVTGCAAAACHGGPIDQRRGEYTTWITRDPHARAFSTLFSERSLEMASLLSGGDATNVTPPHEDQRCLACHAPTGPASERAPRLASDGVGCEACHGAAEAWATEHSTVRWNELNPAQRSAKRRELGMTDMHDPLVRVEQCTACHVGSAAADVNHDLIAAGHPRMSFEMGAFHAELPKHWPDKEERRKDPALEAKFWAIGQAMSAAKHEELVAARSAQTDFLEFANYDCYACHHELRSPSWRQANSIAADSDGSLKPLRWYGPLDVLEPLPVLKSSVPRGYDPNRTLHDTTAAFERGAMEAKSGVTPSALRDWGRELNTFTGWDVGFVEDTLHLIAGHPPSTLNWDVATQWYLAIVALERSRLDFRGTEPPSALDLQVQSELLTLKRLLNFPVAENKAQLDSPRDFDPKLFRRTAARLQALISQRPRLILEGETR